MSYSVALSASKHRSNDSLVMAPSVTAACDVPRLGLADGWLAGSDVRVHAPNVNVACQNRPGLPSFKSKAAIKVWGGLGTRLVLPTVLAYIATVEPL